MTPIATQNGWDSFEGSTGKCWFIANAIALHAASIGIAVEFWRVENVHSTRAPDDESNFIVIEGWAVDFASRGGAGKDLHPWPLVCPVEQYMAAMGGPRISTCTVCGSRRDHSQPCDGPHPNSYHTQLALEEQMEIFRASGFFELFGMTPPERKSNDIHP
jgi:hypothetical protein